MKIFGFGALPESSNILDEISLWHRVQFINIEKDILYSAKSAENTIENELFILHLFEYMFEEEDADEVIYIKSGFLFDESLLRGSFDALLGPKEQYKIFSRRIGYEKYVKQKLKEFRGQEFMFNEAERTIQEGQRHLSHVTGGYSCSICIRKELVFSRLISKNRRKANLSELNDSVALLVPTKNSKGNVEDCPIVKYLIRSILKTIELDEKLKLYIGYDRNDPILRSKTSRNWIKNLTRAKFSIKFIEFPVTGGWLTFIWNVLYVEAYHDEFRYFLQLNDDIKFKTRGWIKSSLKLMKDNSNVKIIGFNDDTWQCRLYTQTLVDRDHYNKYNGHYFPLKLRNWYSDNWISYVYIRNGQGKCNEHAKISNGNVKTRYEICGEREFISLLENDLIINNS